MKWALWCKVRGFICADELATLADEVSAKRELRAHRIRMVEAYFKTRPADDTALGNPGFQVVNPSNGVVEATYWIAPC